MGQSEGRQRVQHGALVVAVSVAEGTTQRGGKGLLLLTLTLALPFLPFFGFAAAGSSAPAPAPSSEYHFLSSYLRRTNSRMRSVSSDVGLGKALVSHLARYLSLSACVEHVKNGSQRRVVSAGDVQGRGATARAPCCLRP